MYVRLWHSKNNSIKRLEAWLHSKLWMSSKRQVNLRGKDWARKRRVRPAMITTAMRVWSGANTNYNDGCSFEKFLELSQLDCFYCGARPANKANPYARPSQKNHGYLQEWIDQSWFTYNGLDRIDSTKNHSEDNIVPACKICNWAKSNMKLEVFYAWVSNVYNRIPSHITQSQLDP